MKKKITFLFAIVMACALTACASTATTTETEVVEDTQSTTAVAEETVEEVVEEEVEEEEEVVEEEVADFICTVEDGIINITLNGVAVERYVAADAKRAEGGIYENSIFSFYMTLADADGNYKCEYAFSDSLTDGYLSSFSYNGASINPIADATVSIEESTIVLTADISSVAADLPDTLECVDKYLYQVAPDGSNSFIVLF